ncbi:hypothetical protein L9F63_016696, partial [Diploptera punctata]
LTMICVNRRCYCSEQSPRDIYYLTVMISYGVVIITLCSCGMILIIMKCMVGNNFNVSCRFVSGRDIKFLKVVAFILLKYFRIRFRNNCLGVLRILYRLDS